jgi:DNA-3-methyladenine glycosylase
MTDPIFATPIRRLDDLAVVPRGFYQRGTEVVARDLLGKIVIRRSAEGTAALRLTEVEAYLGPADAACHTHGGRRTARVRTMWGEAGHAYVYLIYGIHHCLNLVTVGGGAGEAVLVRGALPVYGLPLIRDRRGARVPERSLTDGPGKLCQGLAITRDEDGMDVCDRSSALYLCDDGLAASDDEVERLPRVGVDSAGDAAGWLLRFKVR